ncbi:MAG: nickel pincer cofactor biosynthesis protein LarC [Pirellulales bacterium]|nr:nickel pincer cofactor biosynthesis protein LarC [Pirellulales bacterium]
MTRIAYLDCASGISGDMTLGALVDAGADPAAMQDAIDSLGLPSCRLVTEEVKKAGFRALQMNVNYEPEHAHRHLHHIVDMIDGSSATDRAKSLAKQIFQIIGEAEAKVHGTTIQKVHFHEVGAVDSIADVVGTAVGFDLLDVERVTASPIPTGHGYIQIAHGRTSIPAPATAEILAGVPLAETEIEGELTTPTGAAIVKTLCQEFGPLPAMSIEAIGYGAGQRDYDTHPNLLRLIIGQTQNAVASDTVWLLETNLDDVSGEVIGHTMETLLAAGALDVYTTAIGMKKNRPGTMLSVLAPADSVDALEAILFRETTTLGIRRTRVNRHTLRRSEQTVDTAYGPVLGKVAELPDGSTRFAPEYESARQRAQGHNTSIRDVYAAADAAYRSR